MTRYEQLKPGVEFVAHRPMSLEQMAAEYAGEELGDIFNHPRQCNLCPMTEQCEVLIKERTGIKDGEDIDDEDGYILQSICKKLFIQYLMEEVP